MSFQSNPLVAIAWILLGVILLGFYNGLLLLDDKTPEDDPKNKEIESEWHFLGAAIFLYLAATAWIFFGVKYIFFSLSSFWLIFSGIVHNVGLSKPIFYVGATAKTDKLIRKYFSKNPEMVSAILKVGFFIFSLLIIFLS